MSQLANAVKEADLSTGTSNVFQQAMWTLVVLLRLVLGNKTTWFHDQHTPNTACSLVAHKIRVRHGTIVRLVSVSQMRHSLSSCGVAHPDICTLLI